MSSLSYKAFLSEKLGVISRVTQTSDIFEISKIANKFIYNISKHPEKPYTEYENLLKESMITIKYIPDIDKMKQYIFGEYKNNTVYVYRYLAPKSVLFVKYALIHELLHAVQEIYDKEREDPGDEFEYIRYILRIDLLKNHILDENVCNFAYLMYREDLPEIRAWANDAYITAYMYKMRDQNMSNTILVNKVLKEIRFNTEYLNRAIKEIKTDETAFLLVICVLIGHFYELTQSYSIGQKYFDKEIFRFPVIKKMRQELYDILDIFDSTENICEKIYKMIDNNYDELLLVKDKILSSFISHLRYWYKKTLVQMGKAITLGIEDASE